MTDNKFKTSSNSKRKAAELTNMYDDEHHVIEETLKDEKTLMKRAKKVGIEITKVQRRSPLLDLLFHPTMTLDQFQAASSTLSSSHLHWRAVLEEMDCSRPEYSLFLERLHAFLQEHNGCKADKAITILSKWETLSLQAKWESAVDLIEMLLTFVEKVKYLLHAVAQVRDDKECRNKKFFSLLIHHIRFEDEGLKKVSYKENGLMMEI